MMTPTRQGFVSQLTLEGLDDISSPATLSQEPAIFTSSRFAPKDKGYELSSQGDKRFSALNSTLADGRTIEQAYQLDVKGFRSQGNDWRLGKGRPALDGRSHEALWVEYLALWRVWAKENPALLEDLREKAAGLILTDKFASSPISQARALAQILNETTVAVAAVKAGKMARPC